MKRLFLLAGLMLLPISAYAHPGHGGLLAGVLHPLSGVDHLAAMFAVGLLAARLAGRGRWVLPAGFVLAALIGALLGFGGLSLPALEPLIVASVVVLGVLLTLRAEAVQLSWLLALVLPWGLLHGNAHALEASGSPHLFVAGFLFSTALLHAAGLLVGARAQPMLLRAGGGLIAGLGGWLLWGALA